MSKLERLEKFLQLAKEVKGIVGADIPWDLKYDMIFCPEVSTQIFELVDLNYYDPDMDYEDDVLAFARAVEEKAEEIQKVVDVMAAEDFPNAVISSGDRIICHCSTRQELIGQIDRLIGVAKQMGIFEFTVSMRSG